MEKKAKNQKQVTRWDNVIQHAKQGVQKVKIGDLNVKNNITDINPVADFKDLLECYIYGAQIASADILKSCMKLKEVTISDCYNITSIGFLQSLPDLQKLNLRYLKIATLNVSSSCNQLKVLSFIGCSQLITITGLENCQQLQILTFYGTIMSDISSIADLKNLVALDARQTALPDQFQVKINDKTQIANLLQVWKQTDQYMIYILQKVKENVNSIQNSQQKQIIDDRLEKQSTNFQELSSQMKQIAQELNENKSYLNNKIDNTTQQLSMKIDSVSIRIDQRYNDMNSKINNLQTRIDDKFDHIEAKFNATQQQVTKMNSTLQQLMNILTTCNDD